MRLKRERISALSKTIVEGLLEKKLISGTVPKERLTAEVDQVIFDEIRVEDRLNDEVRELLKAYESQIKSGAVDYQKMFTMVKSKLVRERGIIL